METEELVLTLNKKLNLTPRIPIHQERRRSDDYPSSRRSEHHQTQYGSLKSTKSFLHDDLDQSDDELLSLSKQKKSRGPEFPKRLDPYTPTQRSCSSFDEEDGRDLKSVNRKNIKRSRSELIFYKGLPEGKARGNLRSVRSVHSLVKRDQKHVDIDSKNIEIEPRIFGFQGSFSFKSKSPV